MAVYVKKKMALTQVLEEVVLNEG